MLGAAGIRALVLQEGRDPVGVTPMYRPMQILVERSAASRAIAVMDAQPWRYSWVRAGLLRLVPGVTYWWDRAPILEVYWSLSSAPLPPAALQRLTAAVWRGAQESPDGGLRSDPAAWLVHLAVQSCRPGRGHEADWADFTMKRASANMTMVETIARTTGVWRSVQRASAAARAGGDRPGPGPLYDGVRDFAWRALAAVAMRVRPVRLRRLLAGAPAYGDAGIRCRVAGVEVIAGPGVFVPAPELEVFVEAALREVEAVRQPTIVEVGTGCGAMAIAIAQAREDAVVHGAELSAAAVRSANANIRRLRLERVRFHRGSLLEPLPTDLRGSVDLVIANLPYIPASEELTIGSVPRQTIEGSASDGLGLLRRLARDAIPFLKPGGRLQVQMLAHQWDILAPELSELGYEPGSSHVWGSFAICSATLPTADSQ